MTNDLFAVLVFVLFPLVACDQSGNAVEPSRKLQGIVTPAGADGDIVFLGYRPNLQQQLVEVTAGGAMAEPWHKLELPKGYLPTSDAEKVYDLSQDVGITLTENEPFGAFSTQPNDPNWGAYSLGSGTQGLTGKLTITGANIVKDVKPNAVTPQGEFYGIAYSFTYHGPLNVSNGLKLQNSTHSGTVGAFASKTNP